MKLKSIVCAVAALSMGLSGFAFAQQEKDLRIDRQAQADRAARPGDRPDRADRGDRGRPDRREPPPRYVRGDDRRDGRGAGPDHNFYRGGRLPPEWRSRQYVVDDWRGHRLSAPPRGYHWVQSGSDYLLVAITTGIIASILLNQ